jgi:uncharacterized protein (DUF1330 family)
MNTVADRPFTLVFVGYAEPATSDRAAAYEDAVLPLLDDHGARLLFRGRRASGQDASLPLEVHLIWFPDRSAFESYMDDGRRSALMQEFGEVFTVKHAVEMDTILGITAM